VGFARGTESAEKTCWLKIDTESEDEEDKEDEKEDPNILRCPTCKAPVKIGDKNCENCDEALLFEE